MVENNRNNLIILSSYRKELMGIAILLILIFHAFIYIPVAPVVKAITQVGRIGVDIFLILSAVGLYFSLKKNSSLSHFYKKRFVRIVPTYIALATPYFLYTAYTKHTGILGFLLDLSFYTGIRGGNNPFYFIELILICYLLMPFIFKMSEKKWGMIGLIALCGICYIVGSKAGSNEIILNRIPIFSVSVFGAKYVYEKRPIRGLGLLSFIGLLVVVILMNIIAYNNMVLDRMFYSLCSIPLVLLLAWIMSAVKASFLQKSFVFCGAITLEIYMINFPVMAVLVRLIHNINLIVILFFIMTIGLSWLAHIILDKIVIQNLNRAWK